MTKRAVSRQTGRNSIGSGGHAGRAARLQAKTETEGGAVCGAPLWLPAGRSSFGIVRSEKTSRPLRHFRLSNLVLNATILGIGLALAGCLGKDAPAPTAVPPPPAPTPVVRGPNPADLADAPAAPPAILRQAAEPRAAISYTLTALNLPGAIDARPGAWSPDGSRLVAYVGGPEADGGWRGRLWLADAESAEGIWDSGDMEGDPAREQMAVWLADGSLALARHDGSFVNPDGEALAAVPGIDGQPRQVFADPSGSRVLLLGPEGAWIAAPGGAARFLSGWPAEDRAGWSFSPDGTRLALGRPDGRYTLIDLTSGEAERITEGIELVDQGPMPPPRWLADGRLLLTAPRELRYLDGSDFDYRLIELDGLTAKSLSEAIGIAANPLPVQDLVEQISPDGRYLLFPQYLRGEREDQARLHATWIYDIQASTARPLSPLAEARWSPAGDRLAIPRGDAIDIFDPAGTAAIVLPMPAADRDALEWSPDGRWILSHDGAGGLWLAAADGSAAPLPVAQHAAWSPRPSWRRDGNRLALARAVEALDSGAEDGARPSLRILLLDLSLAPLP